MGVRLTLLGPVGVSAEGRPVGAAPRQRAMLAYLLLHAGTPVSAERLTGAMWGGSPPGTARSQLHTSMAAIRRTLREAGAPDLVATRPAGYVALPAPGQLDLAEFTERVTAARSLPDAEAAAGLRGALGLWRGEPLGGITASYVDEARARLEERRLAVLERVAELELTLGRHAELADELAGLAAAHPLRERFTLHLMLALHRCGRTAEALAAARVHRAALAEGQGLDPGRAFTELESRILRDDPGLSAPAAAPEPPSRVSHLPYDTPDFTGRAEELARLTAERPAGLVAISAIDGMAGIGKTALAIHAAHKLAPRYPDGQLFMDLRAHTAGQEPASPGEALGVLLGQLGVPAERIPASADERGALWRAELSGKRVLVVLDNASGTAHVRPLLPGVSPSLILITSRRRLVDLDGARAMSVDALPAEDALPLFAGVAGERAGAEPEAVLDVLRLCGFLPLAIRIAAARLAHRPQWTVEYLAGRLRDERRRLGELSTADRGVAAAFTLSYRQLDSRQRRMFRLAGLHPGRDIDAGAAAALAGVPLAHAETLLEDLLDAHMLAQREPGRYTFHDLLREHSRATVAEEETADARTEALTRLIDHYQHGAERAMAELFPSPGTPGGRERPAKAWLDAERANLLAVAAAAGPGRPGRAARFAQTLHRYLDGHCHHADALTLHGTALHVSRATGDRAGEAHALVGLGIIRWRRGEHAKATADLRAALPLAREIGDRVAEFRAVNVLGLTLWTADALEEAEECFRAALAVARETGDRAGEGSVLNNLGVLSDRLGHHQAALEAFQAAGALHAAFDDISSMANAMTNAAWARQRMGDFATARGEHRRAVELFREACFPLGEIQALNMLGNAERELGEPEAARNHHEEALELALTLGNQPSQAMSHAALAQALLALGERDRAREQAGLALELYTLLDLPAGATEVRELLAGLG
ncbi:SARP family transcriptional regulator [Actinorhabdospora filicis]|uniref:SARP family transcriptional regulator n=1 Tax=Actinorhabdospora filicis TaxID=1785913 RepID=A0A9W6SHJ0_9ACTN|nr:BTAD domain-containing putative transcriptional regulator [Actinorhabdospora filicis]GLZ75564.1 SARP family transcriptional regulator [Actinorhabdospora filicis]